MSNPAAVPAQRTGSAAMRWLDAVIRGLTRACDWLSALICAILIVVTAAAMVVYQFGIVIPWLDDVLRMLIIWTVYLGAVSLCLHNEHISMDAVYLTLPPPVRRVIDLFIALIAVALCTYIAMISTDTLMREIEYEQLLPSGYLPSWPHALALPVCFSLMALAYLASLPAVLTGKREMHSEAEKLLRGVRP